MDRNSNRSPALRIRRGTSRTLLPAGPPARADGSPRPPCRPGRLVRVQRQGTAVAGRGLHALGCAGQRGHAPADAGGPGPAGLGGVAAPLAGAGRSGRRTRRGGRPVLGPAGLSPARPAPARGRRRHRDSHGGEPSPAAYAELLDLPGVGSYTAAAVAAFAFGRRETVVDTNIRRVHARLVSGSALPAPALTAAEMRLARSAAPGRPRRLGALERRRHGTRRAGLHGAGAQVRRSARSASPAPGWRPASRRRRTRPRDRPGTARTGRCAAP